MPQGTKVFVDATNFDAYDGKYAIAKIRSRVLESGANLVNDKDKADAIVEIRSGALSTDDHDMIVGIPELIELVSSVLEIRPGDVIASGTPEGVGPIAPGDEVTIEIERVGRMSLRVEETDAVPARRF